VNELVLEYQSNCWDTRPFLDLDTGRTFAYREQVPVPLDRPFESPMWWKEMGIDVYCNDGLTAVRAQVWSVDNARWDSIEAEIRSDKPLDVGKWAPSSKFIARDPETGEAFPFIPATFLFRTVDGSPGILQVLKNSDEPPGVKLRYRLFTGGPAPIQHPLTPEAPAPKNLSYGPVMKAILASPRSTD
jgi:hypothetical protein